MLQLRAALDRRLAAGQPCCMSPDTLFGHANLAALGGWALLVIAPLNRRWTVIGARLIVAILCGGYVALLASGLIGGPGLPAGAGFTTLHGVRLLLSSPQALLAGWVHYLAFDLFIGSWETEVAPTSRVSHALLLPCLALTFVAGPVGLLLFLLVKAVRQR
jgi:hypothetical protein